MILTRTIYEKAVDFNFTATYKGRNVVLIIKSYKDRFAVFIEDKLIGQINIGYDRHTWYVVDSNYVEYKLVKEIGQRILAQFY